MSVWKNFNEFFIRLDVKPATWEERIILFAGHLIGEKKQSQTVRSYVSAIKAILKIDGIVVNEDKILLHSIIRACRLHQDRYRIHLPIQKSLLFSILDGVEQKFGQEGQAYLRGSCSYTKHCFVWLIMGCFKLGSWPVETIQLRSWTVHVAENKQKWQFILRSSKTHGLYTKPQTVKISSVPLKDKDYFYNS